MYLLDTNIISELRKPRPHGAVVSWISSTPGTAVFIPSVAIGELQWGIEVARRQEAKKASELEAWLELRITEANVLPMDASCFRIWAKLLHGRSQDLVLDAMIAATAIVHRLTVVTRNVRDFEPFAVPVLNPFSRVRN